MARPSRTGRDNATRQSVDAAIWALLDIIEAKGPEVAEALAALQSIGKT